MTRRVEEIPNYQEIRDRVSRLARQGGTVGEGLGSLLCLGPDFLVLLVRLSMDDRVRPEQKRMVVELLLTVTTPGGFLLDVITSRDQARRVVRETLYQLDEVLNRIDPVIVRDNWPGTGRALDRLQLRARDVSQWTEEGFWSGLKRRVERRLRSNPLWKLIPRRRIEWRRK